MANRIPPKPADPAPEFILPLSGDKRASFRSALKRYEQDCSRPSCLLRGQGRHAALATSYAECLDLCTAAGDVYRRQTRGAKVRTRRDRAVADVEAQRCSEKHCIRQSALGSAGIRNRYFPGITDLSAWIMRVTKSVIGGLP
jgi:hypothetical protein